MNTHSLQSKSSKNKKIAVQKNGETGNFSDLVSGLVSAALVGIGGGRRLGPAGGITGRVGESGRVSDGGCGRLWAAVAVAADAS